VTAETTVTTDRCPTCGSADPNIAASSCHNFAWHRGDVVHLQNEPLGTPGAQCNAACGAKIDDPPSQLSVDREFVTCRECYREASARRADDAVPGLGDLVWEGKLVPDLPTRKKLSDKDNDHWRDSTAITRRHQELTDDEINRATSEELRAAYRLLRDHHIAETTALVTQRNALLSKHARLVAVVRKLNAPGGGDPR
jgi:hypothetical protein